MVIVITMAANGSFDKLWLCLWFGAFRIGTVRFVFAPNGRSLLMSASSNVLQFLRDGKLNPQSPGLF